MHKRRIRKKLGLQYKRRTLKALRIVAPLQAAMIVAAGAAHTQRIQATVVESPLDKVRKAGAAAGSVIKTMQNATAVFATLNAAEAQTWDVFYRKRFGYPIKEADL